MNVKAADPLCQPSVISVTSVAAAVRYSLHAQRLAQRTHEATRGRSGIGGRPTALISAEPTITPSASAPTAAACSGVAMPNPTASGKPVAPRTRSTNAARSGGSCVPRAGDARQRHQVDEARRVADHRGDAFRGGGRRQQEDQRQAVRPARGFEFAGFFGRQVGHDEAVGARGGGVRDVARHAVRQDGIDIAHQQERLRHAGRTQAGGQRQAAGQGHALLQRHLRRVLDRRPVGQRVGEGHAQLDQIGAGRGDRTHHRLGGGDVRVAEGEVGHQRRTALGARRRKGRRDAGEAGWCHSERVVTS